MTMLNRTLRLFPLAGVLTISSAGCYTADFDEKANNVYACSSDSDCAEGFVCELFVCADDTGPNLQILGPEPLSKVTFGDVDFDITVDVNNLEFSESSGHSQGEGFVQILLDDDVVVTRIDSGDASDGVVQTISLEGLEPGPHHLFAVAMYGDDVPYENPSAAAHSVFFLDDGSPQVAIVNPQPNSLHVMGEDLAVQVGTINFQMAVSGPACHQDDFEENMCDGEGGTDQNGNPDPNGFDRVGHAHMYLLDDFPGCLGGGDGAVDCVNKYVASVRPTTQEEAENPEGVFGTVNGEDFDEARIVWLSAGLQYNDHVPYPNADEPVYDQFAIEVIER